MYHRKIRFSQKYLETHEIFVYNDKQKFYISCLFDQKLALMYNAESATTLHYIRR